MQIKRLFVILTILVLAGTYPMAVAASSGPCIGDNYEQQAPRAGYPDAHCQH